MCGTGEGNNDKDRRVLFLFVGFSLIDLEKGGGKHDVYLARLGIYAVCIYICIPRSQGQI